MSVVRGPAVLNFVSSGHRELEKELTSYMVISAKISSLVCLLANATLYTVCIAPCTVYFGWYK